MMVIRTSAALSAVVETVLAATDNAAQSTGVKPTPIAVRRTFWTEHTQKETITIAFTKSKAH